MDIKYKEVYEILLGINEISETQFNRLISIYGENLVNNVIKKLVKEDKGNLDKFKKYAGKLYLNIDLNDGLVYSFDYYLSDISKIDMISDEYKDKLLSEILLIIEELEQLFILVGCDDNILDGVRKPWINDKVEYCLNNCSNKELLNKINGLYNQYIIKRNRLMEGYLRFVISIAKDYVRQYGLPFDDLIQYGNIGLIRAIEMYDPQFNAKFTSYAGRWIHQSIIANSRKTMYEIRKPSHMFELNNARVKAITVLTHQLGREPSNGEIADYMELSLSDIDFIGKSFLETSSLDEPIETTIDGVYLTKKEYVVDESVDVESEVINRFLAEELNEFVLQNLNEKEIFILKSIYFDEMTLVDIASLLGLSHQRIGQIHSRAIEKLSNKRRARNMRLYLR